MKNIYVKIIIDDREKLLNVKVRDRCDLGRSDRADREHNPSGFHSSTNHVICITLSSYHVSNKNHILIVASNCHKSLFLKFGCQNDKWKTEDLKMKSSIIHNGLRTNLDQTFFQARSSYLPNEVLWGYRFVNLLNFKHSESEYKIDYSSFHSVFK